MTRCFRIFVLRGLAICFLISGSVCSAQTFPASSYAEPRAQSAHWYGWQTLTADVVSVGVTALGVYVAADGGGSSAGWGIVAAGLLGYTAITPLLHLVHGNWWVLGSLLLRGAALAVTVVGTINLIRCIADNPCWGGASVPLFLAGPALAAVTTVLDAVFAVKRRRSSTLTWTPWADTRAAAGGFSIIGRW
jgi:hypothetical protein